MDLGLEVETFREARCGCSSLGCRVRVDLIGRDCELEISKIRIIVDLWDWGFLRELFRRVNQQYYLSEGCPYIISIVGVAQLIYIGGLSIYNINRRRLPN